VCSFLGTLYKPWGAPTNKHQTTFVQVIICPPCFFHLNVTPDCQMHDTLVMAVRMLNLLSQCGTNLNHTHKRARTTCTDYHSCGSESASVDKALNNLLNPRIHK
jgi:hypothetical protein